MPILPYYKVNLLITLRNECRLLKYTTILINYSKEVLKEFNKEENFNLEISDVLNLINSRKQYKM